MYNYECEQERSCLAIIPARGGSKGLPQKNLRLLAGKPLVAHTIEQAQRAKRVSRVVVSTDDAEIASVAHRYEADVVMRPVELGSDTASSESALLHTLTHLAETEDYHPDLIAFLQCTSPLTLAEDIDATIRPVMEDEASTALAVCLFHHFLWSENAEREAIGINHDKHIRLRRQEKEPQYLETGAVYVMETAGFLQAKHRFFGKTVFHIMPAERTLEIDDAADLDLAEIRLRKQMHGRSFLPEHVAAIVFDFDGVFTDNRVLVLQNGQEAVTCDRGDGYGLSRMKQRGMPLLVLSQETNPVVQARCEKLHLSYRQGIENKKPVLLEWLSEQQVDIRQVVYLGNDVNDVECLQAVGCGVVVADAHPDAKRAAQLILSRPGGQGAIRELIDLIDAG